MVWKRDLRADYKVPQDFFGTASTPLVEGALLIVNVGAPGGPCVVGLDKATGREVWRAGTEWGPSYASPVPAIDPRPAPRVRLRRRRVRSASRRADVDRPGERPGRLRVSVAQPQLRIGQRVVPGRLRQQGVHLGQLPDRQRAGRGASGLHAQGRSGRRRSSGCTSTRPIHRDGYLYGFDGRNEPDASLACVDAATGKVVWRETPEWTETFGGGRRRRQQIVGTYRGSLLAVDGQFLCLGELGHLLWMDLTPKGYKEVARAWLFAARESWALPVLSRGLLYVVQNTRDAVSGSRHGCSATTCAHRGPRLRPLPRTGCELLASSGRRSGGETPRLTSDLTRRGRAPWVADRACPGESGRTRRRRPEDASPVRSPGTHRARAAT